MPFEYGVAGPRLELVGKREVPAVLSHVGTGEERQSAGGCPGAWGPGEGLLAGLGQLVEPRGVGALHCIAPEGVDDDEYHVLLDGLRCRQCGGRGVARSATPGRSDDGECGKAGNNRGWRSHGLYQGSAGA